VRFIRARQSVTDPSLKRFQTSRRYSDGRRRVQLVTSHRVSELRLSNHKIIVRPLFSPSRAGRRAVQVLPENDPANGTASRHPPKQRDRPEEGLPGFGKPLAATTSPKQRRSGGRPKQLALSHDNHFDGLAHEVVCRHTILSESPVVGGVNAQTDLRCVFIAMRLCIRRRACFRRNGETGGVGYWELGLQNRAAGKPGE
jgi:hypothetical protein